MKARIFVYIFSIIFLFAGANTFAGNKVKEPVKKAASTTIAKNDTSKTKMSHLTKKSQRRHKSKKSISTNSSKTNTGTSTNSKSGSTKKGM